MRPTSAADRTAAGGCSATAPRRPPAPATRWKTALVLSRALPALYRDHERRAAGAVLPARSARASPPPAARSDPRICLLTPGPYSETYFEQAYLARYLGFLLVEGGDLDRARRQGACAHHRRPEARRRHLAAHRRRFRRSAGTQRPLASRRAGPCRALRAGGVVVANMPGSGVLEAPALMSFMPRALPRICSARSC